ncbi:MAG: hypothetical protein EOP83_27350, partial [Verrucomicrobiaceae bacterium]
MSDHLIISEFTYIEQRKQEIVFRGTPLAAESPYDVGREYGMMDAWMREHLPHRIDMNAPGRRFDKAKARRWLNRHAQGQWAWYLDGVGFSDQK